MQISKSILKPFSSRGFTLIELLVVIGILGMLATLTLVAVVGARYKVKIVRAQGDVKQLATAIQLLADDTGKWPGGCPTEQVADPEIDLSSQASGITQLPAVGITSVGPPICQWTSSDLAKWNGPYMKAAIDPWNRTYIFDPDYVKPNCPSGTAGSVQVPTVMSGGPTLTANPPNPPTALNDYDCDNITYELR